MSAVVGSPLGSLQPAALGPPSALLVPGWPGAGRPARPFTARQDEVTAGGQAHFEPFPYGRKSLSPHCGHCSPQHGRTVAKTHQHTVTSDRARVTMPSPLPAPAVCNPQLPGDRQGTHLDAGRRTPRHHRRHRRPPPPEHAMNSHRVSQKAADFRAPAVRRGEERRNQA